jgi:hypothetical protein
MFGLTPYAGAPYAATGGINLETGVSEGARISDVVSSTAGVRNAFFEDSAQALDLTVGVRVYFRTALELVLAADAASAAATFIAALQDSARASGIAAASVAFPSAVNEIVAASDQTFSVPTYRTNIAESSQAFDSVASAAIYATRILELAQASVEVPTNADLHIGFQDGATAQDRYSNNIQVYAFIIEGVRVEAQDFVGRFLWELIDDTQNANWQNIATPQNPGWVMLQTDQGVVWQLVDTTQADNWQLIDSDQIPGWETINNI